MNQHYLLGVVPATSTVAPLHRGQLLIYTPAPPEGPKVPLVGLYEPVSWGAGGSADASTWLRRNSEAGAVGWFDRVLLATNCAWFAPFLHRLAANENVTLGEIQTAYAAHNQGAQMPQGPTHRLFELASRLSAVRGPVT